MDMADSKITTGQFFTAGYENGKYDQFNIHTPPDINGRTRIIAVLGIVEDPAPNGNDGWFLSDFFAFWHIFQGLTETQHWYHCVDLDDLVAKHSRYLHGNPYGKRKVVLDKDILAYSKTRRHPPQHIKPVDLKNKTQSLIAAECKAAEIAKEPVLIVFFGHGDRDNHGISLGKGHRSTLKIGELRSATKRFKVDITLITASCYSGGWTCKPQLNLSTMTSARDKNPSLSWRFSGLTGRAYGSMFTTALVRNLTSVAATGKSLGDEAEDENEDFTEDQEKTYAEFTRTVHEHLLKDVDRRGFEHGLTFGAQDDAWSICWRERTGIPLGQFEERWKSLEDWERDQMLHPGDPLNRDSSVTQDQISEYLQLRADAQAEGMQIASKTCLGVNAAAGSAQDKRKTSGLYGGTNTGLISMVSSIGAEYLKSYQGFDDTGDDGGLHNSLRWIQAGQEKDMDRVERAYRALEYRMTQMSTADRYIEMMGIDSPKGQQCCEYDTKQMSKDIETGQRHFIERLIFDRKILFPPPVEGQGRPFYKGLDYLVAALHYVDLPRDVVVKKIDALASALDQSLEHEKEMVKHDLEVTSKRRRLYHAFGVALGDNSPSKRRSRGLSLAGSA